MKYERKIPPNAELKDVLVESGRVKHDSNESRTEAVRPGIEFCEPVESRTEAVRPGIEFCESVESHTETVRPGIEFCESVESHTETVQPGIEFCGPVESRTETVRPGIEFCEPIRSKEQGNGTTISNGASERDRARVLQLQAQSAKEACEVKKKTATELANLLLDRSHLLKVKEGGMYFFNGICFESLEDGDHFGEFVYRQLHKEIESTGSARMITEIIKVLRLSPNTPRVDHFNNDIVAFNDAVLNFRTGVVMKPTHLLLTNHHIDASYKQGKGGTWKAYEQYLNDCYGGKTELVKREMEILGWILSGDLRARKFLVLLGPRGTGKSQKLNFFTSFFRRSDVGTLDLENLKNRFAYASIHEKRIAVGGDLPDDVLSKSAVARIKMLTGDDLLRVEYKGKNAISFQNTCRLAFASNFTLKISQEDEAFVERVLVLPMCKQITQEERIVDFFRYFDEERNAIAVAAIEAYQKCVKNHYVFSGEKETMELIGASVSVTQSTAESDRILEQFMDEKVEITSQIDDFIASAEFYQTFCDFCAAINIENPHPDSSSLSRKVKARYDLQSKKKRKGNSTFQAINGIRWKANLS